MPRKVRELRAELSKDGFVLERGRGKGSHTVWSHPLYPGHVTLSGQDGDDAQPYQEKQVRNAIHTVREAQRRRKP
jgi:predicted RNA binding protein YcfA (HicA-like mRNA interferase family)